MNISELFYSLQGEGKYVGTPSIFIRTSGCNLRCQWKRPDGTISRCDTPYTSWNPEKKEKSLDEILAFVSSYSHVKHVVITGGEPFLQMELSRLCTLLQNKHVTIETNATLYVPTTARFISMSPKLSSSNPKGTDYVFIHEKRRKNCAVIRLFMQHHDYQLKFVISRRNDMSEVWAIQNAVGAPSRKIYLMPEGKTAAELCEIAPFVAALAKQHGFLYTDRLHIRLWGDQRGV